MVTWLATYMLQEEVSHWLKSLERSIFARSDIESISWVEFLDMFNREYFLEPVKQKKALEFTTLMQEEDSI